MLDKKKRIIFFSILQWKGEADMQDTEKKEGFQKELNITEEEIQSYSECSERTQRCLTDCPWPFPGSYITASN